MPDKLWFKSYDPGTPHSIDLPDKPCHLLLEERAAAMPDGTACTVMGMPTTYAELNARANRFANALLDYGIKAGDRVAIIMGNSPTFLVAQQGIIKAGAVVVTVNPLYTGRELAHVLGDSGSRLAVVLSLFAGNVEAIQNKTSLEKLIAVPIPGMDVPLPDGSVLFDDFIDGKGEANLGLDISPDAEALVIYTGGTTGLSKGAALTHRSMVYDAYMLEAIAPGMTPQEDSFIMALPIFHIMGNAISQYCLHAGLPIHLVPQPDMNLIFMTIDAARPTWFPGVPTLFIGLMNHPEVGKHDLTCLRYCISGAAPFAVEALERFESITGCRVIEVFGLTEAGAPTHMNPFNARRKIGSVGVPLPGMDARIVDLETGEKEMPVGEPGELVLAGAPIMKHYLNMPDETAATLRNGWLHTADVARMDEDGFFWIVDRTKDLIIAGGFNVYPREVDEVLFEHPAVALACAIGVPDEYRGETVKAFIVLKEGETATAEEISAFCRERLAAYKVPKIIEFRDALPLSPIGKVLRKELRAEESAKQNK